MKTHFKKILFSLLLILPSMMQAVTMPNNPKNPVVNLLDNKDKPKNLISLKVKVNFYGTETDFEGKISIPSFKVTLISEKKGFQFYKELTLPEIKTIKILKWKGYQSKSSKDNRYNFFPSAYQITDQNGTSFLFKRNIQEINDFLFETEYGKTKLFAYYIDYLKGSYWEMTKRKTSDLETSKALAKVVNEIEILEVIQNQSSTDKQK